MVARFQVFLSGNQAIFSLIDPLICRQWIDLVIKMASGESSTNGKEDSAKSTPRDARAMKAILKEMGVEDYEPRVINQMLEFTYRK